MNPVLAHDIVLGPRIWEIVHLHVILHAFPDKAQAVLPDDDRVYDSLADEKLAFEVLRLGDEAGLSISVSIFFRITHISLTVHHFVPLPVNDRTAGNTDFEYLRIVGYQGYGHETAVAPSMHSYSVGINVRQFHQSPHADHLVGHFGLTALSPDCLFVVQTSVGSAPVVLDIDNIASLGHVHFPAAQFCTEGVAYHL